MFSNILVFALAASLSLAATATTCPPTTKSPVPEGLRCGVPGNLTKPHVAERHLISTAYSSRSLYDCSVQCLNLQPTCQFLTFTSGGDVSQPQLGDCRLYNASGQTMGAMQQKYEYPQVNLWNIGCFTTACPTSPQCVTPHMLHVAEPDPSQPVRNYTKYYTGYGHITDSRADDMDNTEPAQESFYHDLAETDCATAAQRCADDSAQELNGGYPVFDLHWELSTSSWICLQYSYGGPSTVPFDVDSHGVAEAYGYSSPAYFGD